MDKVDVNGANAHPLYKYLRERQPTSVGGGSRVPTGSSAVEWYVPCCAVVVESCLSPAHSGILLNAFSCTRAGAV
jgi:hypothetical protein